jgi:hypothetical protein
VPIARRRAFKIAVVLFSVVAISSVPRDGYWGRRMPATDGLTSSFLTDAWASTRQGLAPVLRALPPRGRS